MSPGHAWRFALVAVLLTSAGRAAGVVELRAESSTVERPGATGRICIGLRSGGEQVAGAQNDLVWGRDCATLRSASSCRINPATGKELHGGFPPQFDFTYRALVLSLTDLSPIPDGQLYCCDFVAEAAPGSCCPIGVTRAGASDPRGNALGVRTSGAQLCVAGGNLTPVPTATVLPGGGGDGGCQVGGADPGSAAWWFSGLALFAILRRSWRARGRPHRAAPPG